QAQILEGLYKEVRGPSVEFLAISLGEPDDIVREFVEERPFPYPVALDTEEVLGVSLQVFALPTVMVVDPQGRITYLRPGLSDANTLRQVLNDSGGKQASLSN
ncbi:MAG: TlpA disulfide reductase family protein, partial [Thermoanaerobaculia bacterium]